MGRVDEEHVTFTGLGGGQDRLQFGLEKSGLVCNVLGQVFFWRHGDRTDPVKLQAQILEELGTRRAGATRSVERCVRTPRRWSWLVASRGVQFNSR